ncbi:MAG: glycosyltransferase [Acidimicrobiales bacterium]
MLAGRDAVGQHTLAVDDLLRDMGADTEIFAAHVHPEVRDRGRDFREHATGPAPDLIIYQTSIGSPVGDYVMSRPEPLVLNYHNMTPAEFFDPWEPAVAAELDHGRRQLVRLARRAEHAIAVSQYNADELLALGMDPSSVSVSPVLFVPLWEKVRVSDPRTFSGVGGVGGSGVSSSVTMLFVGRLSPNKCQQDLVGVLAGVVALGVDARLVLVGGVSSSGFVDAVVGLAEGLGVLDRLVVAGSVSEAELVGFTSRRMCLFRCRSMRGFVFRWWRRWGLGCRWWRLGRRRCRRRWVGRGWLWVVVVWRSRWVWWWRRWCGCCPMGWCVRVGVAGSCAGGGVGVGGVDGAYAGDTATTPRPGGPMTGPGPRRRVDLVLPELHERDATSTHARLLRDILQADGHRVRFVVERPTTTGEAVTLLDRWKADADLTILQHSIGSLAASEIARRRIPVVVNYHNITPPEFVEPWQPEQIQGLRWGREQLWELRPFACGAIADSDYNARELREVGYESVSVSPVLFVPLWEKVRVSDPRTFSGVGGVGGSGVSSSVTMLFVGRLSPNKCQQDLVGVLAGVVALGVDARLVLVGGVSSSGFVDAVVGLAEGLGVLDRLVVAGSVSEAELVGFYESADVFVSVSEHEGFCVPVVEALGFGVPVVAFGAAAVPETLGGAGLVVGGGGVEKSVGVVVEAVVRVLSDGVVREGLVSRGRVRAVELGLAASTARMRATLQPLLEGTP